MTRNVTRPTLRRKERQQGKQPLLDFGEKRKKGKLLINEKIDKERKRTID